MNLIIGSIYKSVLLKASTLFIVMIKDLFYRQKVNQNLIFLNTNFNKFLVSFKLSRESCIMNT